MESFRQVFPHLVLQQRALNIGLQECRLSILNSLFNLIAAKDLHQQSTLIEFRKYPDFKHLAASGIKKAILSREYKVNLSRLTIELLKEAERAGAIIANHIDIRLNGNQITFKDQISGGNGIIQSKRILKAEKISARSVKKNIEEKEKLNNPLRVFGKFADYQITFLQNKTASVEALGNIPHSIPNLSEITKETKLLQKATQAIDENDLNVLLFECPAIC
jgi:hypothetical protein